MDEARSMGIEPESVPRLLTKPLLEKVKAEAVSLNLVKGEHSPTDITKMFE